MKEARRLAIRLDVTSDVAGAPVRWDVDLDREGLDGWIDPDSWSLTHSSQAVPFQAEHDTLDFRRHTLRFRAPAGGTFHVEAACTLGTGPIAPLSMPKDHTIPLIAAGEAISLGSTAAVGDLHVGLQTAVGVVDWFGRGEQDVLLTCHGHAGGAFLYVPVSPGGADGDRPVYRRMGRLPGFGDDHQGFNARVRAVDFSGEGRFDLLECRGSQVLIHHNTGAAGAPVFAPAEPLVAGGEPFDLGVRLQSVCTVDLGDGRPSLIAGTNDWSGYWPKDVGAWEDKPGYRPYEEDGTWRGGPLRGHLYLLRNTGQTTESGAPAFAVPVALQHEDGTPLEVYGLAGPAIIPPAEPNAGFDLLVSDFLDRIWYFRNTGRVGADGLPRFHARVPVRTTGEPVAAIDRTPGAPMAPPEGYAPVRRLPDELVLPTCMHALAVRPAANGALELLIGAEDGYVRVCRWSGVRAADGAPIVTPPQRLQEIGAHLSAGAKACPNVLDWDGDGRPDLVIGNAAGQILLSRNMRSAEAPTYAAPEPFSAGDRPLWLMAGPPGTMQGPSEVRWGYINPGAGPWQAPGAPSSPALVCGDSLGHNTLYLVPPAGAGGAARVSPGRRLHVMREGRWQPLVTRWRCRPQLVDWGDGETVYVQVDEHGKLVCYRILSDGPNAEQGTPRVAPLRLLRYEDDTPIQLDSDYGGRIGRLKLAAVDWDGDGLTDLLMGGSGTQPVGANPYKKATIFLLRNTGTPGRPRFARPAVVPLEAGQVATYGGHSCVPAPCFMETGRTALPGQRLPDLLVGSENGRIYAYRRSYVEAQARLTGAALVVEADLPAPAA